VWDLTEKETKFKKGGSVAQMVDAQGPEFNPQYCQKTKKLIISV
jgi:hypothetical protein